MAVIIVNGPAASATLVTGQAGARTTGPTNTTSQTEEAIDDIVG